MDHDTLHDYHEPLRVSDVDDCESGDFSKHEDTPINTSVTSSPSRLKLDFGTLSHVPWALTSTETPTMNIEHDCNGPPINLDCKVRPAPTSIHLTALAVAAPVFSSSVSTKPHLLFTDR